MAVGTCQVARLLLSEVTALEFNAFDKSRFTDVRYLPNLKIFEKRSTIASRGTAAAVLCAFVSVAACSDHKRAGASDSDLTRDLQLAGQIAAQPTFQDTALSSTAAPVRASAPAKTPTPARTATRRERSMSPAQPPLDVTPRPPSSAPIPLPAPAPGPSREIGAGTGDRRWRGRRAASAGRGVGVSRGES